MIGHISISRRVLATCAVVALVVVGAVVLLRARAVSGRIAYGDRFESGTGLHLGDVDDRPPGLVEGEGGRVPLPSVDPVELTRAYGDDWPPVLRSAEDLERFVGWMRGLRDDELLRLSNAEFDFKGSEIIDMLHALEGEWVVPALGSLAVAESSDLLKAVLVEGLCGGFQLERVDDVRFVPILEDLLGQLSFGELDPYEVGRDVIFATASVAIRQGRDYVDLVAKHLAVSDNQMFLIQGYLLMGSSPGSEALLTQMVTEHPSADGRMGALEGVGSAAAEGKISPEEVTRIGLLALENEASERNRLLLLEMMASGGGESGLQVLERMLLDGSDASSGDAAKLLALRMEPERALALFEQTLLRDDLGEDVRNSLFTALGALPGGLGTELLLDVVEDSDRPTSERLAGLQGLWNGEFHEAATPRLENVMRTSDDPALRAEALRMLCSSEGGLSDVEVRELARLDPDPEVRTQAILMASMRAGPGAKDWLEERLSEDSSLDVRAAALGGLVMHAHYTGGGEAALAYLSQAESLTDDPEILRMIENGRELVNDYDPRRLELELAEEAAFWVKVAAMTEGAPSRSFRRRGEQLTSFVATLRSSR